MLSAQFLWFFNIHQCDDLETYPVVYMSQDGSVGKVAGLVCKLRFDFKWEQGLVSSKCGPFSGYQDPFP
jgi:hypothetical protein